MLENIAEKTLSNGLKVICLRKEGAPVVGMQVWYRTGSVNEAEGIRGISHFVEHMMFRGSENVGPEEHSQRISEVGGHCNAFTAEDVTAFVNAVPRDHIEMVFELEADRMRGPSFDQEILQTESRVIVEEYHTYMNNPVTKAFLEFRKQFFGDHPYALSPLGKLEDLQSISADDARTYFRNWYTPSNATCVVVGDIDSTQSVFELAERTLGTIASRDTCGEDSSVPVPAVEGGGRMERRIDFNVPLLVTGFPAPPSSHEDALALEILQLILSQGQTGRLHRELVKKKRLAVMTGGMNHCLRRAGISLFFAAFTPDVSVEKLEQGLNAEIDRIRTGVIDSGEMAKVKNATLTNRVFELYSAEHVCTRIGYSEVLEGDYRQWVRRLDLLERLSVDQLVAAAAKYWSDSNRSVLYLRPKKVPVQIYAAGIIRRFFGSGGA